MRRARGEDSAQEEQARGIAIEPGEARADQFGGFVPGGGVKDVIGFAGVAGTRLDGTRPRLSAAAIARATQVFPEPGSPESMAKVPETSLSCQSQSTGRSSMSDRQTRSAWRSVTAVESVGGVGKVAMGSG